LQAQLIKEKIMGIRLIKENCAKLERRHITRIMLGAFAMSTLTLGLLPADPSSAATCGQKFQPRVNGGEAAWSLHCDGNKITIDGWVKDTKADGKCAYVKAFGSGQNMPQAKACPKNKVTFFRWTFPGSNIQANLFVT
jgi:hypothetical protein